MKITACSEARAPIGRAVPSRDDLLRMLSNETRLLALAGSFALSSRKPNAQLRIGTWKKKAKPNARLRIGV